MNLVALSPIEHTNTDSAGWAHLRVQAPSQGLCPDARCQLYSEFLPLSSYPP